MKFSKKSRYGVTALIDLAIHSGEEQVALNSIAERNDISPQYLEQVFAGLRRAGIVRSIKGPQGGYFLGYPADHITVADILIALEGSYHIEDEDVSKNDGTDIPSTIQELIVDRVNRELDEVLTKVTLEDLKENYEARQFVAQDMYYI